MIEGDCVKSGLDRLVSCAIKDMPLKTCRYGLLVNESGGVIDDLIVFRVAKEKWFIVVNGATTDKDARHFQNHLTKDGHFSNISSQLGKLDVQGPASRDFLKNFVEEIGILDYYCFGEVELLGEKIIIDRKSVV